MFPSLLRRVPAALLTVALLLAAFPAAVSAAADASITGAFAPLDTCSIDTDGREGPDPCLRSEELLFELQLTNTGDAALTHVELTGPLSATGVSGPARVVGFSAGVACKTTPKAFSCFVGDLPSTASVHVVLAFDPVDTPDVYLETVDYRGLISVTAKASTKSGSKANFQRSVEVHDTATFLLSARDADRTQTYRAADGGQEATVTLPDEPAGIFAFVDQLVVSRGDEHDFCGSPGLLLGTCFGLAVHIEVETGDGVEYVFDDCDLTSEARAATCLAIEITWDPTDPSIGMPLLYQQLPSLITAYDHGDAVEKCASLVDLSDDAGDPNRACSTDATIVQSGEQAGWIVMTIYAASNGNWGAG